MGDRTGAQQGFIARRKSSIVLIYTLLGPALGGMMTATAIIMDFKFQDGASGLIRDLLEIPSAIPTIALIGIPFGYLLGGAQALACGILLSMTSGDDGRFGYFRAGFMAAIVASLASVVFVVAFDESLGDALILVGAGVPTSLLLRFLFRKKFGPVKSL